MKKNKYKSLEDTLHLALLRASVGKGADRHANDNLFEEQDILTEMEFLGIEPAIFQIRKKAKEALRLSKEAAKNEFLDIIVYAAAVVIKLNKKE